MDYFQRYLAVLLNNGWSLLHTITLLGETINDHDSFTNRWLMVMDWYPRHHRDRKDQVGAIVSFVTDHPHSYASLAVCRRALDSGIERISGAVINELEHYLSAAPEDEIDAYYSIIR